MTSGKWDKRIERAHELAATHAFAAEGLQFYERIASFQKTLYAGLESGGGKAKQVRSPGSLPDGRALVPPPPWFGSFLSFVADVPPAPLSGARRRSRRRGRDALG